MAKIKINDLPRDLKVSEQDLKKIKGGQFSLPGGQIFGFVEGSRLFGARKGPTPIPIGSIRI